MSSSLAVALATYVAYLAVVGLLWRVNHVRYDALAESRRSIVRGIVVPIGIGSLLLAAVTTWQGWWRPALFDDGRVGPSWALVVPVLLALVGILGLAGIDWRSPAARTALPVLAAGTLLVGFAEELLCRGLLVLGGRDSGWGPWAVFLLSTALFSLVHAMNGLFGQSLQATLAQLGLTFVAGAAFYVTRLSTGTLLVGMLLHALWDFGLLGQVATGRQARPVLLVTTAACYAAAVVATPFVVS